MEGQEGIYVSIYVCEALVNVVINDICSMIVFELLTWEPCLDATCVIRVMIELRGQRSIRNWSLSDVNIGK